MELIEVYRDIEIHRVLKNGRLMFQVPCTCSFDVAGARKAIDKIHYTKSFSSNYLTMNRVSSHSGYSPIQAYSIGEYYDSIKTLNRIVNILKTGNNCNRLQVL